MARPYGKFKRTYARRQPQPEIPQNVRAEMPGRMDLEEASYLLQTFIARLQEQGVQGLEGVSVAFTPLRAGAPMPLAGEDGKPVSNLKIHLPAAIRFAKAISL